jgi:hypothetical protein
MAWQDVAAKVVNGFSGAAGNTDAQAQVGQWQQQRGQQQADALKLQIAPLTQAIAADRQKLTAFIDDKGNVIPEHQKDYDATVKNMGDMLGRMRGMMGQREPGDDPNYFESTIAGLTDKLHITRDLAHQLKTRQQTKKDQWNAQNTQTAQDTAAGTLPYAMTPEGQAQAAKTSSALTEEAAKAKDASALKTQEGEQAIALEREKQKDKPSKGLKAMEQGGVAFGIEDQDRGAQYLPSQLGPNGNAPPEAKQMWQTYQQAKQAKEQDEQKKEDFRMAQQARTIAAGFERMGQSQQFQELMAQYRSDLTTYRAQNTLADNSEATVNALKAQYAQPGNKAVADNELQNFYTTVVQKGGRKTAAELALTLKIGSFGMNLQQMAKKAATGELPKELRESLLSGMEAVAKEQRAEAEKNKPELPKLNVPEGPKTKQLKGGKKLTAKDLEDALQ